eukprot:322520-Amphidinium_carterae.1
MPVAFVHPIVRNCLALCTSYMGEAHDRGGTPSTADTRSSQGELNHGTSDSMDTKSRRLANHPLTL